MVCGVGVSGIVVCVVIVVACGHIPTAGRASFSPFDRLCFVVFACVVGCLVVVVERRHGWRIGDIDSIGVVLSCGMA